MDRRIIDGVPILAWGKSGETTFCGALSAALAVTDRATDYVTLMGDSGLATRLRWYRADELEEPRGWCNSSPVGEFSPWTTLAAESIGWRMRWETFIPGFNVEAPVDMGRFRDDVVRSIDAGVPVLCYPPPMTDLGVIYGYEDDGKIMLARSYYEGSKEFRIQLKDVKGLLAFLEEKTERPSPRERAVAGLRQMVDDFTRKSVRADRDGRIGEYRFGEKGYVTWIGDLMGAGKLSPEQRGNLFRASWWTFDVLVDARFCAAHYLRSVAEHFEQSEIKSSLNRAADAAKSSAMALCSSFQQNDAFFGPWSGKKIEDWNDDVRNIEIDRLTHAMASDREAIREIGSALATQ